MTEPSKEALEMAANCGEDFDLVAAALQKLMDERDERVKYAWACEQGAAHWKQRAEAAETEVRVLKGAIQTLEDYHERAEAAETRLAALIEEVAQNAGAGEGDIWEILDRYRSGR